MSSMISDNAAATIDRMPSARRSEARLRAEAKANSRAYSNVWTAAKRATLFIKKPQIIGSGRNKRLKTTVDKNGKTRAASVRTKIAASKHAYKVLVSAAAAEAAEVVANECAGLRCESGGELKHAPALPMLSDGARLLLDQALVAYAQTHFSAAVAIKDRVGMHGKVSEGCMQAACQMVDGRISGATAFIAGATADVKLRRAKRKAAVAAADAAADAKKKKKKKKRDHPKKDGAAAPPTADGEQSGEGEEA